MEFALTSAEFESSLHDLHLLATQGDSELWQAARIIPSPHGITFRLAKALNRSCVSRATTTEPLAITAELDDPEELCRVPDLTQRNCETDFDYEVVYEFAYSTNYQVPVLYLHFRNSTLRTCEHDPAMLDRIIPFSLRSQIHHVDPIGAISMTDHPVSGMPVYFVHPCNTQEAMRAVCGGVRPDPLIYILRWIGCLGAVVGLALPTDLFGRQDTAQCLHGA